MVKVVSVLLLGLALLGCAPQIQVVEVTRVVEVTATSAPTATEISCTETDKLTWALAANPVITQTAGVFSELMTEMQEKTGDDLLAIFSRLDGIQEQFRSDLNTIRNLPTPGCLKYTQGKIIEGVEFAIVAIENLKDLDIDNFVAVGIQAATALEEAINSAKLLGIGD